MIVFALRVLRSQLVKGSVLTLVSSTVSNLLNILFTISMGRILGHGPFGVLSAAFALFWLFASAPTAALTLTVTKWSASHTTEEELLALGWDLYYKILFVFIGIITLLTIGHFAIGIPTRETLLFVILSLPFYSFLSINTGILSGIRAFGWLSVLSVVMGLAKLGLALLFVFLWQKGVPGGLSAIAISICGTWVLSLLPLRRVLHKERPTISLDWGSLVRFLGPVFIVTLWATAFTTIDILAVKWYLPQDEAGLYAAIMSMARFIFYTASPIAAVLFPLVAYRHSSKTKYNHLFLFTLYLTLGCALVFLAIFWFSPRLVATILYGVKYPHAAAYLFQAGITTSLYTLVWLFSTYLLSRSHTGFIFLSFSAVAIEALALLFFHNSIADVLLVTSVVLGGQLCILGFETYRVEKSTR